MHPFRANEDEWIVKENLFGSDSCVDDFYTRHHTKNRGRRLHCFDTDSANHVVKVKPPNSVQ